MQFKEEEEEIRMKNGERRKLFSTHYQFQQAGRDAAAAPPDGEGIGENKD